MSYSLNLQVAQVKALALLQIDSLPDDETRDVAVNISGQLHEGSTASVNLSVNYVQRPR